MVEKKIDLKDRKILYELDLDCRQSNTQIGKKVGLKRDVVAYRINRMQEEGIITNFWTAINTFRLGYQVYRIYIDFQYVSQNIKDEIIKHFVDYKNTWTIYSTLRSEVDLGVIIWVKNIFEFYQFWEKTLDKFENYFERFVVSIYTQAVCYKKSYLVLENNLKTDRRMYVDTSDEHAVEIDKLDYHILNELAVNARKPLIEVAEKLECSSQTVNYRLKNLIKIGVIQAFRVNVNLSKLNLQQYKVEIYLRDHNQKKSIIDYLEGQQYLDGLNFVIGWADIEPEFIVKNVSELNQILTEIDVKFANSIKKQSYWIIEKKYKDRWLPE